MNKKNIAVIGAGIAGLACAYELNRAGHTVTLYESEPDVGGRMRSREKDGLIFDIGATHLIPNYTNIREYVEELGLEWMPMDFCTYGILRDGKIQSPAKTLSLKGKAMLAKIYSQTVSGTDFRDLETAVDLDTDNAYDFAVKNFGQEIADYIVDPFTAAYQFHRATEVSVATLKAIIQSVKEDPKGWNLHRIVGGMSALPAALSKNLDVKTNTPVTKIEHTNAGVVVTAGTEETFDTAVVATTATVANDILESGTMKQHRLLDEIKYASSVSIAFRVKADSLPKTSITWIPYVENTKFSGISNEVMKGADLRNDSGEQLLCTWMHDGYARHMLERTDEQIWEAVLEEFPKICPWVTKNDLTPHDLERWWEAMPKFEHGHLTRVHEFLESGEQGKNNIWLCGDYMNAPWIEGALGNGKRVAAAIISQSAQ